MLSGLFLLLISLYGSSHYMKGTNDFCSFSIKFLYFVFLFPFLFVLSKFQNIYELLKYISWSFHLLLPFFKLYFRFTWQKSLTKICSRKRRDHLKDETWGNTKSRRVEIYQIHGSFLLLTMVFIIMVIITIIGRICQKVNTSNVLGCICYLQYLN
jgi:hypothetical protein